MKKTFFGYYPPSPEDYQRLWKEGLIVLDTNVLLSLYRLPSASQGDLFKILESVNQQLWIPHQVALEFHRNRPTVIAAERKTIEDVLAMANDQVAKIIERVNALQLDKRELNIDAGQLTKELQEASTQLVSAVQAAHKSQLDLSATDPIRDRLDVIFNSRVGVGPVSQSELDTLIQNGDERYERKIPPGFEDVDKAKNPSEASFIFGGIKYQKKFGDLIFWRQLLDHAKKANNKVVMLVTADQKEDWWWRESGKTLGPHPELAMEIRREAGVELFWIYTSDQFLLQANTYLNANVSSSSIAEVKDLQNVTQQKPPEIVNWRTYLETLDSHPDFDDSLKSFRQYPEEQGASALKEWIASRKEHEIRAIRDWLASKGQSVKENVWGFPDYLVRVNEDDKLPHGYEIRRDARLSRREFEQDLNEIAWKGAGLVDGTTLASFTIVLVTSLERANQIHTNMQISNAVSSRMSRLLTETSIDGIVVGAVGGNGFTPLLTVTQAR
jgi:hypothetical protein